MPENTCLAGKDVCTENYSDGRDGPLAATWECSQHQEHTRPHHTDGSPCGEGCKVPCGCEQEGTLDPVCAQDLSVEGTTNCGHTVETWDTVKKPPEKPKPLGEEHLGPTPEIRLANFLTLEVDDISAGEPGDVAIATIRSLRKALKAVRAISPIHATGSGTTYQYTLEAQELDRKVFAIIREALGEQK